MGMGLPERPLGALGSEDSSSLSRDDDGAAAAAIAAAAAAAAADGLVLRGDHGDGSAGGPDAGSESDASDGRSPQSPSVDMQPNEDALQQQQHQHRSKGEQQGLTPVSDSAGETPRPQEDSGSGLPFRQVVNAACTAASLHGLAEAFPFIELASCICKDSTSCKFGGEAGLQQQQQQRQMLRMLMLSDTPPGEQYEQVESEPFSLFAKPTQGFVSSCCERHAVPQQAADDISHTSGANSAGAAPSPAGQGAGRGCNWKAFAASLDRELDAIIDELEKGGILEKMQNSLAASISTAVFAFPKAKEARALEAATQPPRIPVTPATTSEPEAPATPATTVAPAATAATDAAAGSVPAKSEEEAAPLVESGGIFSAFAAVDAHCNEITKKFTEKLSSMRRVNPQRQRQRQPRHQLKPYRPLPAYARGQQIPLFPYRNTAPPPPSLLQLRDRRCRLQQHAERKGAWEVREELPHVNASFPDAAWFSLGCCAGRTWRRLLLQSEVTAAQQLQLLRMLQGDDLVEGCFVIDTIHNDHTVARRVVAGRRGRRDFMEALCSPRAVVRGWVVRCDQDRELMLLRLVGAELYPPDACTDAKAPEEGQAVKQESPAAHTSIQTQPIDTAAYLRRRLLRAEVDIGSSGFYAALPLAAIPRYEFIGGQASGCCGRFVCAGTALRVSLARSAAAARVPPSNDNGGAVDRFARLQQPLLDEATLNAAHAHAEASFALPKDFEDNPVLAELLQEPLGFASALPHDAAHPQAEEADFQAIRAMQMPANADSRDPLEWWDGGSALLLSRLPYMLRSSGAFVNPVATHRRLHAFSPLQLLEMAPPPEAKDSAAVSGTAKSSSGCKKRATNDNNRVQVYTEAEAWEAVLKRLSDGCFMSLLNAASPCAAIRSAIATAEVDCSVRGGGIGRLLAQQQGAEWAKRRLKAGVACARRGQLDQALQLYDSALQLRPDYADALIARGAAYANKLEYKKAAEDLDTALALEPTNKNATKYRAIVAERMEAKEPGKTVISGDRDRTPSPDRKCKSPEHARLREISTSRATTIIRKGGPGSVPLPVSRNALSSAAAAANAVLGQAAASGVARGAPPMLGPNSVIDRLRIQQEQQRHQLLLLEQQKRRAALVQKQLKHNEEMERHISERKRREALQLQQAQQHSTSSSRSKEKSHKSNKKDSKSKRKRKHSDSSCD